MNTETACKLISATAASVCLAATWAVPATATTALDGGAGISVWTEPDPGWLIAQRKVRAAQDVVAFAVARAAYVAETSSGRAASDQPSSTPPRPCAKFPDLCAVAALQ